LDSVTRRTLLAVLSLTLFVSSCGKRGDPEPPLPKGPAAVKDLAVDQEGADAVITFTYPDRLLTGLPLTDLESVEIYRVLNPPSALTSPRPATSSSGAPRTDEAPAAGARRAALNARLAEESFYAEAKRVDQLSVAAIAQRTHGARIVYRDPLMALLSGTTAPRSLAYAVVSVRRGGAKSPLSNIVLLSPDVPPGSPTILAVTAEEGRICLEWLAPDADLMGKEPAKVGGYFVHRRFFDEPDYGPPLNQKEIGDTAFVDAAPPYGKLVYTLRATLPEKAKILGPPALEAGVDYRDIFPPPAPRRLDVLSEGKLIRLVWDPVAVSDLAGYAIFRGEGSAPFERLNRELTKDSFFNDERVEVGKRYRYIVKAVDTAGNESPASSEAIGELLGSEK
jgi:hypothetical protein